MGRGTCRHVERGDIVGAGILTVIEPTAHASIAAMAGGCDTNSTLARRGLITVVVVFEAVCSVDGHRRGHGESRCRDFPSLFRAPGWTVVRFVLSIPACCRG